jgi:predicted DNA binding CopG/RHH family protein
MKNNYIDSDEKEIIDIWEDVDIADLKSDAGNIKNLQSIAKEFNRKQETKMTIRISSEELEKIKKRAELEGLKYQTLIKSVLHKYITGQFSESRAIA